MTPDDTAPEADATDVMPEDNTVRHPNGSIIGLVAPRHPDQAPEAGPTHMIPVVAIPEGATVGKAVDPTAAAAELAAANKRIAELEAKIQADDLARAQARIAELEAANGDTPEVPAPKPAAAPDPVAVANARIAELEAERAALIDAANNTAPGSGE